MSWCYCKHSFAGFEQDTVLFIEDYAIAKSALSVLAGPKHSSPLRHDPVKGSWTTLYTSAPTLERIQAPPCLLPALDQAKVCRLRACSFVEKHALTSVLLGGIFARLRRGRSKMSMKDDDETSSRLSDAEGSFINHTPTKSPSKAPSKGPALSLPLSFANASQTNLREDTGISQYLSSNQDPSPITPKNESLLPREEPLAPKPATPRKSTAAEVPTASRGSALDVPRPETGRSAANSYDNSWQSRVVIEMKEKEQLIGRFEALSRVHMALQDEVEKERIRADSAEAAARKRDPSFGKRTPNGDTSLTNGTVAGAAAGPTLSKEDEDKAAKQREQLQQQRSEFERQKEEFRQAKADIDRERTIMQTQRAELERQKEAHASSLADHEQSRSAQASAHSEQASRDRELHGTQLSDLRTRLSTAQSDHAKDREAHAAEISNLNAQLNRDRDHHVSNTSDLHNQLATAETSTTSLNNELSRLRTHNDQLKTQISKSTLSPAQTTDDEFVTQLSSLQSDVRLWVTNNFSRSRIDFEKLEKQGDSKELKQIRSAVPQYKKAAEQSKIDFLQALVSAQLMDKVWDDDFYVAMPAWEEEHETKDEGRGGLTYLREPFKVISGTFATSKSPPIQKRTSYHTASVQEANEQQRTTHLSLTPGAPQPYPSSAAAMILA